MKKKRPILIIDPRAGHGPGIGGLKRDSEVGVAMKEGHPVYFASFFQTLAQGKIFSMCCMRYAPSTN
ncbi:TPA: DUF3141 domain-containing protein [Legionella anisa]|nr:DUF3141 domain-containing protein [Legionella anisa]MBN5937596.1 DUF3141 domain-containing protein [Legionella anisa]